MAKIENKICAVTVTYGNRWSFLSQVINRLLNLDNLSHIVIVNNGSAYNVHDKLHEIGDSRLLLINHDENMGSAGGYHAGIKYAHQKTDANFIWLLDDDNLPESNSLDVLLSMWNKISAQPDKTAFLSLRTDREIDLKFAKGANPYIYYLIPNSFLGFSFTRIGQNKMQKIIRKVKKTAPLRAPAIAEKVKMPYVPYGGFFMHRLMIDKIGYPNEHFYLYVDDEEYSYRITQNGGDIYLIPASNIKDIDNEDVRTDYKPKAFASKILDLWSFRMYYRIRNSVYFHQRTSTKTTALATLNRLIFMFKLKLISIISGKQTEYKKFSMAVYDGLRGDLGKASPDKF